MDIYVQERGILQRPEGNYQRKDLLLEYFIEQYFDALYEGRISEYDASSWIDNKEHWTASFTSLYDKHLTTSFIVADTYKEWLFDKLKNGDESETFLRAEKPLRVVFPTADPFIMADLYWFFYNAQNTTDSKTALEGFYKIARPFGHMGRTFVGNWDTHEEEYLRQRKAQEDEAILMFAYMYPSFFRGFWNLKELIETATKLLRLKSITEDEKRRLRAIRSIFKGIKKVYDKANKKVDE